MGIYFSSESLYEELNDEITALYDHLLSLKEDDPNLKFKVRENYNQVGVCKSNLSLLDSCPPHFERMIFMCECRLYNLTKDVLKTVHKTMQSEKKI